MKIMIMLIIRNLKHFDFILTMYFVYI